MEDIVHSLYELYADRKTLLVKRDTLVEEANQISEKLAQLDVDINQFESELLKIGKEDGSNTDQQDSPKSRGRKPKE